MEQISLFDPDTTIKIYCDGQYKPQAQFVLETLKKIFDGEVLFDGIKVQFGWTFFILKKLENEFLVTEPDFFGNPFENYNSDITISLNVLMMQNDFIHLIGVKPEGVSFQDKIVFAKECLSEPDIYLERIGTDSDNDSGWFVGYIKDENLHKNSALEAIYVYELLKYRPEILRVLNLPKGFLVVFHDDKIQEVVNQNNERVL